MENKKGANSTYLGNIAEGVSSIMEGMKLTWKHLRESKDMRKPMSPSDENYFKQATGIVTLQYPKEKMPVPDNGRYRLHNEIDDCIVCDACARVCPVDCIDIDSIKATEDLGVCSDGTKKRLWAPTFDIDMAKCCYCGLCTTVCPTECLTMTKVYDFSEFDRNNLIYHFGNLTPAQADEKRKLLEEQKKAAKAAPQSKTEVAAQTASGTPTSTSPTPTVAPASSAPVILAPARKKPIIK